MPNLVCKCGNMIDLSTVPCPNGYSLISDADMEVVYDALEDAPSTAEALLEKVARGVVICDVCGRYYISKGKESVDYFVLSPEMPGEDSSPDSDSA